ncbi:MAG: PhoH family protein [Succiniclasticum sp.]|nr:PhoH family protein [Succiniclasticum sp.]MDY2869743.1 PhoH family protein [Succiniclasticum sp.]MDY6303185.1 PhoH family protein [Succiniclasticum sp.]MDY6346514.1 PhoH family protein [Succiniclasticum sp.]
MADSFLAGEQVIEINNQQEMVGILGRNDEHLRLISASFDATIVARGNKIIFSGSEEEERRIGELFRELLFLYRQGLPITSHDVRYSIYMVQGGAVAKLHNMYAETLIVTWRGHQIKAKTLGQYNYVRAIRDNFITFGIGPAGTGKTYLAVAMAVTALKKREVERIILTRPAVEAGEKLGYLPGDMQEKVDPYLRPLYDALYDMLGSETAQKYLENGVIEVAPLAYMRGRTLNGSFIILDEAQNTTPEQMKMFLTRFGFGSRMVVTGDITQIDLPSGKASGLIDAARVLRGIPHIGLIYFDEKDVVRHEIVGAIIKAYERADGAGEHEGKKGDRL